MVTYHPLYIQYQCKIHRDQKIKSCVAAVVYVTRCRIIIRILTKKKNSLFPVATIARAMLAFQKIV